MGRGWWCVSCFVPTPTPMHTYTQANRRSTWRRCIMCLRTAVEGNGQCCDTTGKTPKRVARPAETRGRRMCIRRTDKGFMRVRETSFRTDLKPHMCEYGFLRVLAEQLPLTRGLEINESKRPLYCSCKSHHRAVYFVFKLLRLPIIN